jgi:hypothetical protein
LPQFHISLPESHISFGQSVISFLRTDFPLHPSRRFQALCVFSSHTGVSASKKRYLDDLEKLCELLQCAPNDLMEWIPSSKDKSNDKHPLISIKRSDKVVELTKILNSVPLDKLNEIERVIKKDMEK